VARGANRSAVSLRNNLKQMLNWAQKRQPWRRLLVEGNPMDLIEIGRIVSPDFDPRGVRERVLSIPKENVKDRISSLTISLSDFALRYFRRLYDCSGDTNWCFPNDMGTPHIF
jgi:hypothetical protein